MTVEEARTEYLNYAEYLKDALADALWWGHDANGCVCSTCTRLARLIDAASISLDLSYAEAARDITRRTVAW